MEPFKPIPLTPIVLSAMMLLVIPATLGYPWVGVLASGACTIAGCILYVNLDLQKRLYKALSKQ